MDNIRFSERILKNAELMLRLTMIVAMVVAGVSKFLSAGGFYAYYLDQFANPDLRIHLPSAFVAFYLEVIPYLEVLLGLLLVIPKYRRTFAVVYVFYILSLAVGHYVMEEFETVDMVLPLTLIGVADYILPAYQSYTAWLFKKKKIDN